MPTEDKNANPGKAGEGNPPEPTPPAQGNQPESFEAWLQGQPENVKSLYDTHVQGLKNTVTATRTERDDLKKQIAGLLKQAEKGSEAEKQLADALGKIETAEKKAAFMEEALKPEIGCRNPRTAYALAVAEDFFTRSGSPDWNAIKAFAPELFQASTTKGNAGSGTGEPPKPNDMNAAIRKAAGVQ